jgi:acyl carrier protein
MTPDDVAILMQDLLDSDEVAVDDSFFDAGGTSMTALTLISEVQRLSGVSLPLIDIVRNPTPDGIARLITQRRKEAAPGQPDAAGAAARQ